MELANYFELEKGVSIEVQIDSRTNTYSSIVKKIKEDLVALQFSPPPEKPENVPQGILTKIIVEKEGATFYIQARIISNKTFPIIVLKIEKLLKEEAKQPEPLKAEKEMTAKEAKEEAVFKPPEQLEEKPPAAEMAKGYKDKELYDNKHVAERESARIEDSFPMEFYLQTKEEAEEKKRDYLIRKSSDRRESAAVSTGVFIGYSEADAIKKVSHLDASLIDIVQDIYRKMAVISTIISQAKPKVEGENVGVCVDISGLGLKLICTQKFNRGDILKLIIAPPKAQPPFSISALGEVMRAEDVKADPDQPKKYAIGIKYYAMHEDDMELITQYTFQLQREMLRMRRREKGLEE
jgi:c-di-GMP-binding flagellar brake protein YcgR